MRLRIRRTSAGRSTDRAGSDVCLRPKASSWRVSSAARSAARRICRRSSATPRSPPEPPREQLGVAEDGRQQVVEVVGDAAREPPHGLHLLDLAQPLLEALALADLVGDDQTAATPLDLQLARGDLDLEQPAVARAMARLGSPRRVARPPARDDVLDQLPFLGRMRLEDAHSDHLILAVAVALERHRIHHHDLQALEVVHPDGLGKALEELREAFAMLRRRSLGPQLRSDVAQDREMPTGQHVGDGAEADRHRTAVLAPQLDLAREAALGAELRPALLPLGDVGDEVGDAQPEQLLAAVAEQPTGGGIGVDIPPIVIDDDDGIERVVEDRFEQDCPGRG